jgi:hypothetical protein
MNKAILRSVIRDLTPNKVVKVGFRDSSLNGTYTVFSTRKGRGKHGSLLAMLRNEENGNTVEIGTPKNLEVLNLTVDDAFYGVNTAREEPPAYVPNFATATLMRHALDKAIGPIGEGKTLHLESTVPEYNGTFTVLKGQLERGKYGQVHLWLVPQGQEPNASNTVELWSYRHSGIITSFTLGD